MMGDTNQFPIQERDKMRVSKNIQKGEAVVGRGGGVPVSPAAFKYHCGS